jgi:uncharacterized protein with ParB-like and HNH nuclease domain
MSNPIKLNVGKIFMNDFYIIPLYQRNYAWEEAQVTQLVRDIWDFKDTKHNYYIGTLIVHRREDEQNKNIKYATIDGQQRLTSLNILFSVMKNEFQKELGYEYVTKLQFDSRPLSSNTLKVLSNKDSKNQPKVDTNMQQAYYDMTKQLILLAEKRKSDLSSFFHYLKNRVMILRVEVPKDTDLNHYFEIMNNRGEQLEKHEILKSTLLNCLRKDAQSSEAFSKIWEACSSMNRYAVLGFKKPLRKVLFRMSDRYWRYIPESFDEIKELLALDKIHSKKKSSSSFMDIIDDDSIVEIQEDNAEEQGERFNSVINFPNFLLHVLRIMTGRDIPLDDKRLLLTFDDQLKDITQKARFVKTFAWHLLKARLLFDRYIIKREYTPNGDGWSLKEPRMSTKSNNFYYINTYRQEEQNHRIIMLLSMFHVSFPQIIYKHWLSAVLKFLMNKDEEIPSTDYINFLECLSDAFYFDRFGKKEYDYYEIIFRNNIKPSGQTIDEKKLNLGVNVQNFIFNRLDYLIWRSIFIKKDGRFIIQNANNFQFTFRSSVEHYYPQNPKSGPRLNPQLLDCFGNLCLISRSKNSELSNYSPMAKAQHYENSSTIESLKQRLMMKEKDNWDKETITKHHNDMLSLLNSN